jgi:hypothetical protein
VYLSGIPAILSAIDTEITDELYSLFVVSSVISQINATDVFSDGAGSVVGMCGQGYGGAWICYEYFLQVGRHSLLI